MRWSAVLTGLALAGTARAAPVRTSQSDPHPGIHVEHWLDSAVPAKVALVRIDLTSAEIAVYATKESDRGITTSGFSDRIGAQVAINGDAFAIAGYTPRGLAIGDSTAWTNTHDTAALSLLHLRRVGERTVMVIEPPELVIAPDDLPEGTQGALGGRPLLVRSGAVESNFDCADPVTLACQRAPRSAAGLSGDGNTLWLATVDGWQSGSVGLTASELGGFLAARGATWAMALDGGSSATMVVDGAVITSPSDGIERNVANHLGVKYGALPRGELVGLVCAVSVFNCTRITGAMVTLDDGRVLTTAADGFYDFTNVTPRLACVTVKKTGYKTKKQCQIVDSGIQTYNSVVLDPGVDPPADASVPDGPLPTDATTTGDGGFGPDGGTPETGPGGGCCETGRGSPPIALVALVGWMLRRRPRYKGIGCLKSTRSS
ncbi:MAG: phosphodiester glycosidase family protein [Myxococcales bacterium]|nr:phosphodiester glycosidase family protein [Myxococcales bacterium]